MVRQIGQPHRQVDLRSAKPIAKKADNFYHSQEWTILIAAVIKERGRQCQDCGRTGTRIFGDHIKELRDGGPALDRRNIKLLCGSCHSLKTAAERAKRMAQRF